MCSFTTSGATHEAARCHIQEVISPWKQHCYNLKCHMFLFASVDIITQQHEYVRKFLNNMLTECLMQF